VGDDVEMKRFTDKGLMVLAGIAEPNYGTNDHLNE
jgi:hypothetical protein